MSALAPIQRAVFARLTGTPGLMARIKGVYADVAPQGSAAPYLVIGEKTEVAANTFDRYGSSATLALHIFSRQQTPSEGLDILDLVEQALRTALPLANHTAARAKREITTVIRDPDGYIHVSARVRFFTLEGV